MCVEADRRGPTGLGFESEFESESEMDHRSVDMLLATC